MGTGTLTLALLALSTSAVPGDIVPMNSRNFQIPIHIAEAQRSKIKELLLFASSDEGVTWNQVSTATPDKDAFVFYAPTDGLYWFNICVVDAQGGRQPPDIYKSPPRQKVLVDTLAPNVRIVKADRMGDEITVVWEVQEDHPDLATLKLEHRTPETPGFVWSPVGITPALSGQARFRVATLGSVIVHMQIADQAGNVGETQVELQPKSGSTSPYAPNVPAAPVVAGTNAGLAPPPLAAQYTKPAQAPSPTGWDSNSAAQPANLRPNTPDRSWASNPVPGSLQARGYSPEPASRIQPGIVNASYSAAPAAAGARAAIDPGGAVEITNSTQATIDYEVTKLGPSGVGKVELYLTRDEGRNWEHFTEDSHPHAGNPLAVNLPGEGVYGLRLVVTSGAGLAKKAPQPGDPPQMRVEVDLTPPLVKLFPAQPDPSRRDALLLTWSASDRNLAANPITIQFAEKIEGPWQTIGRELTNSGRYQWILSPSLPYRVYLRVVAYDAAGNMGVDQTSEPVLVDLNEPEVAIRRVNKPLVRQ